MRGVGDVEGLGLAFREYLYGGGEDAAGGRRGGTRGEQSIVAWPDLLLYVLSGLILILKEGPDLVPTPLPLFSVPCPHHCLRQCTFGYSHLRTPSFVVPFFLLPAA